MKFDCMVDVFNEVKRIHPLGDTYRYNAFVKQYQTKHINEIHWVELCDDSKRLGASKYAMILMHVLLQNNMYCGKYSEDLYRLKNAFESLTKSKSTCCASIMCGDDIRFAYFIKTDRGSSIRFARTENTFLRDVIALCASNTPNHYLWYDDVMANGFAESFSQFDSKIKTARDFTDKVLFSQVEYYKKLLASDEPRYRKCVLGICDFYRELLKAYSEENPFANSFQMTKSLIFAPRLGYMLYNDFYFYTVNPSNIPKNKKKLCFIFKGMDNQSTRMKKEDHMEVDLSLLSNQDYANWIIEYMVTSANLGGSVFKSSAHLEAAKILQFLTELKQQKKYPNKNSYYLTNQEAVLIREKIAASDRSISSKNNWIGSIRRFLMWCKDSKKIEFDELFFDYLSQYEEPNKNTAKTIPDEDLVKINNYLLEQGKTSEKFKLMHTIFHIALQTEFRINQICNLTIDCIKPTVKPNQFMVVSNTKTSHGKKKSSVISPLTYHLLIDAIESTETARESCNIDAIKNYIFLYKPKTAKNVIALESQAFSEALGRVCETLGLSHRYTAANLRDTHMTKSLEHIMRNGKSDLEMSVLSKHKHMDTTKNHYIEMELEKMLESTYGITIGTELIETDSKILDQIPEHLIGEENDVEDGCGKCSAETCVMTNVLPCMACKHFITTVKHEVFFKKAIENIDRLIINTKNRHDKEDLVTIKELYVLYLKAIIKHKEVATHD